MRVLLSDGSGLTSRQVATILAAKGHEVHVVAPDPLCLSRFTRAVRRVHRVPAFGLDPLGWLDATRAVLHAGKFDVLLPTQEQVTLLARTVDTLGVATVVPSFDALVRVQDKVAAAQTLSELEIPQPPWSLAADRGELLALDELPVFVKPAIGTAGVGVEHVTNREELAAVARRLERDDGFIDGPVLVQRGADGPLAMVQAVFDRGRLVAFHANLRVRAGSNNGAAIKRSIRAPAARDAIAHLGEALGWHGALSADAILTDDGPLLIDINPRLVEPTNALRAGVDLVGACLSLALDAPVAELPESREGVSTRQTLLGVLGAAQRGDGRVGALRELGEAVLGLGPYRYCREELTPVRHDARAAMPVVAA
jgi:glutathione synthase/RimK-type ligase-like ATP-grasp enzyme